MIRKMWTQAFRLRREHGAENVADMTLGNPSVPPPPELLAALEEIVAHPPDGLHLYTPNAGHPEVRERVARHLDERGVLPGARAEHVVMTSGASGAINIALRSVLDVGDEVILLAPYFPDYPAHVVNHKGVVVVARTGPGFLPDLEEIERAIGPRTRALIVNHPNNPSGRGYPEPLLRELAGLLERASRKNGRVIHLISDEPYRELRCTEDPFVSPARLYEHGLIAYSFSKSHAIPGERIGYLAVNPANRGAKELAAAAAVANRVLGFANAPALWQHVVARCLDAVVDLPALWRKKDRLLAALREKGYEVDSPDGTFYLFPKVPRSSDDAFIRELTDRWLLVVPGEAFGWPGFFRLAFCVDDRTIDLAVDRLPAAGRPVSSGSPQEG